MERGVSCGANSRHAVGVATFWGMLTATLVGMLFVPPLYVLFRRLAGVRNAGGVKPKFGS